MPHEVTPTKIWSSGVFGCCYDCGTLFCGLCCLPCLYGQNTSNIDNSSCFCNTLLYSCCPFFTCCFAANTRQKLRAKYALPEEPCSDCCVHCICSPCAVCQEAREIKFRAVAGGQGFQGM
mmetsp:Transcript_40043/g.88929  ORF Transcript_40043/g.88929 Transcript_40043/m.88929 type:complete len:120 (-) Transcript_40043:218-577(-)